MTETLPSQGIELRALLTPGDEEILTPEVLELVTTLERRFRARRVALLAVRRERQAAFDAGERPGFLDATREIRDGQWSVASAPPDLRDRRVEITGPVDRKMIINALNSGAQVFMADFEDATSPTWSNLLGGQRHLRDAVNGTIEFTDPAGKIYRLEPPTATLMVRPRGWHLVEKHLYVDGEPVSASIFDFTLFFAHNARALLEKGSAPYFYLPKLESHLEARLWNDVFNHAQDALGIPRGTIRATVLIETITAAFEMDEILFELRAHSAGLNCGRWDYIFSFIKKFRHHPEFVLPDRARVTMTTHFLRRYSQLLIQTCHRRGAHALGGMAAQIPVKNDPRAHARAIESVVEDKEREVWNGHDGTWVAHPALVPIARKVFDEYMPRDHQLSRLRCDIEITAADLLEVPEGRITEAGLRTNLRVAVEYLEGWLGGRGCVPLNHLMEDAATAEISRAQIWQWIRHPRGALDDGRPITIELVRELLAAELRGLEARIGATAFVSGRLPLAGRLVDELVTADEFPEFLTLSAYEYL